ncbi:MAG: DUF2520 domain-containing protein [Acidobacteria bacterium]|nr:DUF2520 domain-containing protein [Acidobacteriota bacterium]
MSKSLCVAIVGLGRVGNTLAFLLKEIGYHIETVIGRNSQQTIKAFEAWQTDYFTLTSEPSWNFPLPDLLFITTPDNVISNIVSRLATYKTDLWQKTIVFHCAGALSSQILLPLAKLGASVGSIHPLKSFALPIKSITEIEGIYWCIEGDERAKTFAEHLVKLTKGKSVAIEPNKKALYHAAAVMSCGHLVALLDLSLKMLIECGISQEQAKEMLLPLIEGTIKNFATKTPSQALTGPFAREDYQTVNQHLQALKKLPEDYLTVYSLLGRHSLAIKP